MRQVRVSLTPLQAECLLQLAQEADFETFEGNTRRWSAGEAALDKLVAALAVAERHRALFPGQKPGPSS